MVNFFLYNIKYHYAINILLTVVVVIFMLIFEFYDKNFNQDLPIVFGNKDDFKIFYKNLIKIDFPVNLIIKYMLYESNRWDLETIDNKTIKLSSKNYIKNLKNYLNLKKKNNFKKFKVFDYRINDQLILK